MHPTRHLVPACLCLSFAALAPAARADAGDLDPSFAGGGLVTTPIGAGDDEGNGLALQADRKIVVVGSTSNGVDADFLVVRYLPDGLLDTSFGTGGVVITPIGPGDDIAVAVAVQADGKIVVGGTSADAGGIQDFAVVRYLASGAPDTSFSGDGILTTSFGDDASITALALSGGKIVAAGADAVGTFMPAAFALARYLDNGALDSTFSGDGRVTTTIGAIASGIGDVLVQPDGRIVAAGIAASTFTTSSFALARYLDNGSLDGSFGTGGIVTTSVGAGFGGAAALVRQPDGKLVAGGGLDGSLSFILRRYLASGAVDGTFGSGGQVTTAFSGAVADLLLDPDGRILAAGGNTEFLLARYLTSGALDTSFSGDGKVTTTTGGGARGVVRRPESEYVVAGTSDNGLDLDIGLARYLGLGGPTAFCSGTNEACPCGNGGAAGAGCENSQGSGGALLGATAYVPNGVGGGTATMNGSGFPPALTPAVVLIRSPLVEAPAALFGDGLRCIQSAGLVRIQSQLASGGTTTMNIVHGAGGGTFHYQLWYRSQPIEFCNAAAAFNLSNGLSIPWP